MHLARRIVVIWAIDALALWLLASVIPGLELRGWIWAFWAVAAIGLFNALVRPFLLIVMLPFTVLSLGLLSLALNAFIVVLADLALPGFHVQDFIAALWTVLGIALINTIVTGLLSINDDESFYRNVILRFARRTPDAEPSREVGMVILEIDGLSMPALQTALGEGYMPALSRWIENGRMRVTEWNCGLPSQTSSSQAGILYGRSFGIPAFRWYEKSDNRLMISNRPWTASEIHRRLSDGTGLLAAGGTSLTNLVSGDATNAVMTMSSLLNGASTVRQRTNSYFLFFLNPYSFSRTFVLMVWEILREVGQRTRGWFRRPRAPHTRGGSFPFLRAAANVFLRDLNLYLLIEDMLQGTPVIYRTFLGYDVVAHHAGPLNPDSLRTLKHFDEGLEALERAAIRSSRPYEFVLLSDHGQSPGATFRQRYSITLDELVERALDGRETVVSPPADDEGWAHLNALFSQVIQDESPAGRTARRVLRRRTHDGYVELRPSDELPIEPGAEVVVCASGNLGLVYFTDTAHRLTFEELVVRYPRLFNRLVGHPGIGFVMTHSDIHGAIVIGRHGTHYLHSGRVNGLDPLEPFGEDAPEQLRRLDSFPNVGDLLINSMFVPETGEVAAFEDLVGSHGGLGGDQTRSFIIYPADWQSPEERIPGPEGIHHLLRGWLQDARPEQVPVSQKEGRVPEPAGHPGADGHR